MLRAFLLSLFEVYRNGMPEIGGGRNLTDAAKALLAESFGCLARSKVAGL
jgi:hypothetical protein